MTHETGRNHIWSVILAAENREENWPFMRRWLLRQRPRQYYSFIGNRSIFQQSLDLAELLSPPENRVTIVLRQHYMEALLQAGVCRPGKLVAQPFYRNTAAQVFLGLAQVYVQDPGATVILLPCDHFVYPEDQFVRAAQAASKMADLLSDHIVLLAVPPNGIVPSHGSIKPGLEYGSISNYRLRSVDAFLHEPDADGEGFLCNTLISVAKAETLWNMGCKTYPALMPALEQYRVAIGTEREQAVLEEIYEQVPTRNFFADVLRLWPHRAAVIEMTDVMWFDRGGLKRMSSVAQQMQERPRIIA